MAEDDETNQALIRQQLAMLGYLCNIARDGREAFNKWLNGDYGLVLSNIHMQPHGRIPVGGGDPGGGNANRPRPTPVLALTANVLKARVRVARLPASTATSAKPVPLSQLEGNSCAGWGLRKRVLRGERAFQCGGRSRSAGVRPRHADADGG